MMHNDKPDNTRQQSQTDPDGTKPKNPNVDIRLDPDLPPLNRKQRRRYVATLRKQVKAQLRKSRISQKNEKKSG